MNNADRPATGTTLPISESEIPLLLEVLQQAKLTVWAAGSADSDFAIRLWNQGAERIYGFTRQEALGTNYLSLFVNSREREQALEDHRRIVADGEEFGWNFAAEDVSKDGTVRTILGNAFRVWDAVHQEFIIAEVGIDISDFDRLSHQIDRVKELTVLQGDPRQQLRILRGLAIVNEAVGTLNRPDARGLLRVVHAIRDSVRHMLGSDPLCRVWMFDDAETPRPAEGSDELPGPPHITERELVERASAGTVPIQVVADGPPIVAGRGAEYRSAVAVPLLYGPDLRGVLAMFFRDGAPLSAEDTELLQNFSSITAVALVMAGLARDQQRRRQEETERIRHAIIESVLHTVGNEAGLAKLAADSLGEELADAGRLTDRARSNLDQIRSSSDRLGQIMGELITLTVRAGVPGRLRLADAVRVVTRIIERDHYHRVYVGHHIDPELCVEASEYLLREALGNLVNNAVWAMIEADGGGDLRVSASAVVREWNGREQRVVHLDIEDSGPGVQPQYRQKIWDAGFSTRGEGHGHGLYHTRGLVGMLGGAVELLDGRSELGGAHFRMFLPAGPPS
jgi:PAS domain S-box-containing protein